MKSGFIHLLSTSTKYATVPSMLHARSATISNTFQYLDTLRLAISLDFVKTNEFNVNCEFTPDSPSNCIDRIGKVAWYCRYHCVDRKYRLDINPSRRLYRRISM